MTNKLEKQKSLDVDGIRKTLDSVYGEDGWDGGPLKVKGKEYFVAIRTPSPEAFEEFSNDANAFQAGKKVKRTLQQTQGYLVTDCLVDDVPGVMTKAEFNEIRKLKPLLIARLAEKCIDLADVQIDFLK